MDKHRVADAPKSWQALKVGGENGPVLSTGQPLISTLTKEAQWCVQKITGMTAGGPRKCGS